MTMEGRAKIFGANLRLIRQGAGFSQKQLGPRAGVTHTAISHLESGNRVPSFAMIWKLSEALNVSPGHLLGELGDE